MANIQFGTGTAAFVPSNLNSPLLTSLTPLVPTLLQEMSVDFKATSKELFGRQQFAADVARGKISASGKGKITATDPLFLNSLFFGLPTATGAVRPVTETHAVAASVTTTNAAHFAIDYGVVNGSTGVPMTLVASTPAVGQYSVAVSTGIYTFNASETATSVLISYAWTDTTSGTTLAITNQQQGYSPQFSCNLFNIYQSKLFSLSLTTCKLTDIQIPSKMEDYWISDFSYVICANPAGLVGTIYADQ